MKITKTQLRKIIREAIETETILPPAFKDKIDRMPLNQLLSLYRFSPIGHPDMKGEKGKYVMSRLSYLRDKFGDEAWSAASKRVGW